MYVALLIDHYNVCKIKHSKLKIQYVCKFFYLVSPKLNAKMVLYNCLKTHISSKMVHKNINITRH
jgi:hypothetical protein